MGFGIKEDRTRFDIIREKDTAIKNFPVPTTKEDLLDFAISMQSKWSSDDGFSGLKSAYKAKYDECVKKAQVLFPNDPMFQGVFEQHQADKKINWANMSTATKVILGLVLFILFCVFMSIF